MQLSEYDFDYINRTMKLYIYTLTLMIASVLAVGCGSKINPARNIAIAREAITEADYDTALSALDEVKSEMSDTTASATALTETAALYCVIDEKLQSEDYMDKALGCYELAMRISPDSVRHCFARLTADEKCQLDLLDKLLNARRDIPDYAEPMEVAPGDTLRYDSGADTEIIDDIDIMQ